MGSKLIGQILVNQFRVDEFIAAGGMGAVYKVWDLQRNVPLAMKILHSDLADDPTMFERFKREARALRKLEHPNIVPFYGLYDTGELTFLLERFIDGPNLKEILTQRSGKPLAEQDTLIILKALCSALGFAHSNGVVHCDVKAANVMIDRGGQVFLGDFGIARHADSSTTTMAGAGTPAYMAPEQILSKSVSKTTDVYSLGVLLYEMMSGGRPFKGSDTESAGAGSTINERIRNGHLHLPPPDPRKNNPKLSSDQMFVLLKALEKEPANRFQSCQELLDAICKTYNISSVEIPSRLGVTPEIPGHQNNSNSGGSVIYPDPPTVDSTNNRSKRLVMPMMIAAVAVVIILGLALAFRPMTSPPQPPYSSPNSSSVAGPLSPSQNPTNNPPAPTASITPKATKLITLTATSKPAPTATKKPAPTPTKNPCPGSMPLRFKKGDTVLVDTNPDRLIVRWDGDVNANEVVRICFDSVVKIVDGPKCSDNSNWWYIEAPAGTMTSNCAQGNGSRLSNSVNGWVREGGIDFRDGTNHYFLVPLR